MAKCGRRMEFLDQWAWDWTNIYCPRCQGRGATGPCWPVNKGSAKDYICNGPDEAPTYKPEEVRVANG